MNSTHFCAGITLFLLLAGKAAGETFVFDFPTSLDGWQAKWDKDSTTGTPGVVTHTTERGYLDGASLHFDMGDGLGDDGTLWIDRLFSIPSDVPSRVNVSFQLYNTAQSDFNQFQVQTAILTQEPQQQADFTNIGVTDTSVGWTPFEYEQIVASSAGETWVGVGIRVAWETHREYWIDRVVVTTTPIPEPSTAALALSSLIIIAATMRSRRRRQLAVAVHGCIRCVVSDILAAILAAALRDMRRRT